MEHLKYLAWFNYVLAAFSALAGVLVLLGGALVAGTALMSGDGDAMPLVITGASLGVAALIVGALTVLYIVTGRRVSAGRGRILQSILGVLAIGNIPVGTIYGAYALWVCWINEDTKKVFEEPYGLIP